MMFKKHRFLSLFLLIAFMIVLSSCQKPKVINNDGDVHYEIFVGGFYDTNNDGVGDINGVKEKIPYLKSLGVSGIWLMPVNPSPTYHKYDVQDYYDIDSSYGDLEDFTALIETAKEQNIDILMDLILNHTSIEHPWFKQAIIDYKNNNENENSFKNFYNLQDTSEVGYSAYQGVYYEARFWSGMPDLNLDEPKVRNEILKIAKYWLDMGVKGFRLDAVTYLYNDDSNKNISFLEWFNDSIKTYQENAYIVAEAWTDSYTVEKYYDSNIDSFFNFDYATHQGKINISLLSERGNDFSKNYVEYIARIKNKNSNAIDALFLSNHDQDRSGHFLSNQNRAKLAASVYLLMGGKPFIYYGEEIGLLGNGRDENKRLPMLWNDAGTGHANPPVGYDFSISISQIKTNVESELKDKTSLLNHYKNVIAIHNKYANYLKGTISHFDTKNENIAGFKFTNSNGESIVILHNFSGSNIDLSLSNMKLLDQINISGKGTVTKSKITIKGYNTLVLSE